MTNLKRRLFHWGPRLGILAFGNASLQCGSDSTAAPASAGTGGMPADAATEGGQPECTRDEDCAGSDCNAPALCQAGRCAPGRACENPDVDHCSVSCELSKGKAECVVSARDGDGDGHGTQLCSAKPGDDCDDKSSAVFPGAAETCDRLDNDCDGPSDLDDGLTLGGSPSTVGELAATGTMALAFAGNRFALLHVNKLRPESSADPARLLLTDDLATAKTERTLPSTFSIFEPVLAGGSAVLAGGRDATGYAYVERMRASDASSQPPSERLSASAAGVLTLVPFPSDEVLAVWAQESAAAERGFFGRRIASDGSLGTVTRLTQEPGATTRLQNIHGRRNEGSGDTALTWLEYAPAGSNGEIPVRVQFTVLDSSLASRLSGTLETLGLRPESNNSFYWLVAVRPQVAAVGDRFVFGWLNFERQLVVAAVTGSGTVTCGPTVLPNIVGSWNAMHALESRGEEALAVLSNADDRAVLLRINSRCSVVGQPLELQATGTRLARGDRTTPVAREIGVGHPAIAKTNSGFAVAWIEETAPSTADAGSPDAGGNPDAATSDAGPGAPRLMLRAFSSRLCD